MGSPKRGQTKKGDRGHSTLPPRSRLYSLEPIDNGTQAAESLTSYITRLAEAHGVPILELFNVEIKPVLETIPSIPDEPYILQKLVWHTPTEYNPVEHHGISNVAARLVQALERLVLRNDLRCLTLLPWRSTGQPPGRLLSDSRAWCPTCFEIWRQEGHPIYEPLLWSLQAVAICPWHAQVLWVRCPNESCRNLMNWFTPLSKLGYCPNCDGWLGISGHTSATVDPGYRRDMDKRLLYVAMEFADLISAALAQDTSTSPHIPAPTRSVFKFWPNKQEDS